MTVKIVQIIEEETGKEFKVVESAFRKVWAHRGFIRKEEHKVEEQVEADLAAAEADAKDEIRAGEDQGRADLADVEKAAAAELATGAVSAGVKNAAAPATPASAPVDKTATGDSKQSPAPTT